MFLACKNILICLISELLHGGIGGQSPLLVPQVEDGGPQPQFSDLPPDKLSEDEIELNNCVKMIRNDGLPVLRMYNSEPHQTVFIHSDQTSAGDLRQKCEL